MKNFLFLLFFAPITALAGQGPTTPGLDAIAVALGSGDVDALSKFFGDKVEISIGENEEVYAKAQAVEVLRNFFSNAKPKTFDAMHKGQSRESSDQYCIGKLEGDAGKYRVYVYYKTTGTNTIIQEMRFDKN